MGREWGREGGGGDEWTVAVERLGGKGREGKKAGKEKRR